MKVLIVEDIGEKASALGSVVEGAGASRDDVVIVPDSVAARQRLQSSEFFDVLLLDLQIPNRFGDRTNKLGGTELLRWLSRNRTLRMPTHIVAVTAFDPDADTTNSLTALGIPVVRYAASHENWKSYIGGLISRSLRNSNVRFSESTTESIRAVVLTTVEVEYDQAKRVFDIQGGGELRLGVNWHRVSLRSEDGDATVILAQASQMGMPAAAVLAAKAIRLWSPQLLIMTGICAGIQGEVELGDLIIPDFCWDFGSGKLTSDGLLKPDPRPVALREVMRAVLNTAAEEAPIESWYKKWPGAKPRSTPKLHIRPAASGAAVVADARVVSSVQQQSRKVVGIDMENYGLYYAAANSGRDREPMFCSVKGVVDFADAHKSDHFQEFGAHLSAVLARWLIEKTRASH